jgi:tetratricopeptide (TPR) repeat protein
MATPQPDPTPEELLEIIRAGDSNQSRAALLELRRRAESARKPVSWWHLATGYCDAGMYSDAATILHELVALYPGEDTYRAILAGVCEKTEQLALSRFHFKYLAEHAWSASYRNTAVGHLHRLGFTPRDEELTRLQESSLREIIRSSPDRTAGASVRLARLLLRRAKVEADDTLAQEAASVLEDLRQQRPRTPAILEPLVSCYLYHDAHQRLSGVLRELEDVSPESPGLTAAAEIDVSKNAEKNRDARLNLALALAMSGRRDEALTHAASLAQVAVDDSRFHGNLGQVFWLSGDAGRGRHHLDLASRLAENDEERQQVVECIAHLERQA